MVWSLQPPNDNDDLTPFPVVGGRGIRSLVSVATNCLEEFLDIVLFTQVLIAVPNIAPLTLRPGGVLETLNEPEGLGAVSLKRKRRVNAKPAECTLPARAVLHRSPVATPQPKAFFSLEVATREIRAFAAKVAASVPEPIELRDMGIDTLPFLQEGPWKRPFEKTMLPAERLAAALETFPLDRVIVDTSVVNTHGFRIEKKIHTY
jgi:hypothetical protein